MPHEKGKGIGQSGYMLPCPLCPRGVHQEVFTNADSQLAFGFTNIQFPTRASKAIYPSRSREMYEAVDVIDTASIRAW